MNVGFNRAIPLLRPLTIHFFVNFVHRQGTYFRFHNLAISLTRLGHRVTIYAADHEPAARPRRETRDGIPYEITPEFPRLARLFGASCDPATAVRRAAQKYPPCDVAHLYQPFPGGAAAWLRSPARAHFYDWDDQWAGALFPWPPIRIRDQWRTRVVRFLERRLPSWADHVTAISQHLADRARERGGRSVTVLNSGSWVDTTPVERMALRSQLGLRVDAIYAGFMGRTTAELSWCTDALAANMGRAPRLRLAVCGPSPAEVDAMPPAVRDRVDYLGQLSPEQSKEFAACIDLGLLPMADTPFNRSRLPQKFGDHLASGNPLLCSTVGECERLIGWFPSAIPAGVTHQQWLTAFITALDSIEAGTVPQFDPHAFQDRLAWDGIGRLLSSLYADTLDTLDLDRR